MLPTRRLAELGEPPWPAAVTVCGRVVQRHPQEIDIDDGTAARRVPLPPGAEARAGDHVALELGPDGAPLRLQVLAPWTGPGEFPPVGGEWYRLRRDGARRLHNLRRRAALLGEVRHFFAARGFLEIEAPLLVPSPGLELHLDAFPVVTAGALGSGDTRAERYLITSPEYQLKRLLSGGLSKIYSLGKVFRRGEAGPQHNPEFTMLEWYRAYEDWEAVAADVEALCARLAEVAPCSLGGPRLRSRGLTIDLTPPWPHLTVAEAMARHAGVRMRGDEDPGELRARLVEAGHDPRGAEAWDDLFFSVFLDHVEPQLGAPDRAGVARPVVLHDWPRPLCALARQKPGSPEVVERFEAYVAGLELCNGFGELCDPAEQRRRFDEDLRERRRRGLPSYPVDERFLAALEEGLPPSGGVALGVDRLIMLLCDAATIRDVLPFAAHEL